MFLTPFYRDYAIRAHRCAKCARNTLGRVCDFCRMMALGINDRFRHPEDLLRAGRNAKSATLTKIRVECYFVHNIPPFLPYLIIPKPFVLKPERYNIRKRFRYLIRDGLPYGGHP